MTIQRFAEEHRLKVSRDECGDAIVRGRKGHLYVDNGVICAMWTDNAPVMLRSRLAKLGGRLWQGDISRDARGKGVQDAWVRGIRPEAYRLAIQLVGAKPRRVMSPAQRVVLEKARLASRLISTQPVQEGALTA
jgi:hypothetical protein